MLKKGGEEVSFDENFDVMICENSLSHSEQFGVII